MASQSFSAPVLLIQDREPVRAVLVAPVQAVRQCGRANAVVRIRRARDPPPECVLLSAQVPVQVLERLLRLPDVLWAARRAQDSAMCHVE